MGYRSDVVFAVYKDVFVMPVDGTLDEYDMKCINDSVHESHIGSRDVLVFAFNSIKWYDAYPLTRFFNTRMGELDALHASGLEPDELYAYVRVGEEINDFDTRGANYEFGLFPQMTIQCDL